MNRYSFGIYIILIAFFQSCVPTKKLTYLQDDDSVLRKKEQTAYVFKRGDMVYVRIKTRDEALNTLFNVQQGTNMNVAGGNIYFLSYLIDHEGYIELPVIGKMKAEGKTAEQLKNEIRDILLKNYFKHPSDVYVMVKPAGMIITVLGEVNKPSTLNMLKENPNILEAIAQAGEITLTGNRTDVMVIREHPKKSAISI